MKDLFDIDANAFKYVDVTIKDQVKPPAGCKLLKVDDYAAVSVLISSNVAVADMHYSIMTGVSYLPIEVFTTCQDFIKGLYSCETLPSRGEQHGEIEAHIWKKAPGFTRQGLIKACENYSSSRYVERLCSNGDRVVYVFAEGSFTGRKRVRFEVVDFNSGNNADSVSIGAGVYEAICDLINK